MSSRPRRVSSTRIRARLDCARREHFEFTGDHPIEPNRVMAIGTITHAILEQRLMTGEEPNEAGVRAMKGNYEDPWEALDGFPDEDIWGVAVETASVVPDIKAALNEALEAAGLPTIGLGGCEIEFDLEELGLVFSNGWDAGGYLDLYWPTIAPGVALIFDWKTRGRMDYAPRTEADFRADSQLCYYPSVIARANPDIEQVIVGHGNLLRGDVPGGPLFVPYFATLDRWYLESVWDYFDGVVCQIAKDSKKPAIAVARNTGVCYKYGPCPHMAYCARGDQKFGSIFEWAKAADWSKYTEETT